VQIAFLPASFFARERKEKVTYVGGTGKEIGKEEKALTLEKRKKESNYLEEKKRAPTLKINKKEGRTERDKSAFF